MPPFGPVGRTPNGSGPLAPGTSQDREPRPSSRAPLALGALIVCAAAFLLGWVPLVGVVLGGVGIVLVVLAAYQGLATKRTYAAGAAAALGVFASAAMTVALVGTVMTPGSDPEPVVAEESDGLDEGSDADATPVAEEEPAAEHEQPDDEAETTSVPTDDSTPSEEPEPTEQSEPAEEPTSTQDPTAAPDLTAYEELDERTLAQIVKAPDDHIGRQVVVHGQITQLDAATGKCFVRVSISHTSQEDWYDYEHNTVGFAGDGESDCPVLDPVVADDEVRLWVTIGGSLSYDTQIGGSTTVPAYVIDEVELQ